MVLPLASLIRSTAALVSELLQKGLAFALARFFGGWALKTRFRTDTVAPLCGIAGAPPPLLVLLLCTSTAECPRTLRVGFFAAGCSVAPSSTEGGGI